jgi:hypothetical protein
VLAAFWSGLGGDLAKNWLARVLTPAFTFWAAGLAAVWWHLHATDIRAHGWTRTVRTSGAGLNSLSGVLQVVLILTALLLLAASAFIAERMTLPLLRLLEGYWTHPAWLWRIGVQRQGKRRDRWAERIGPLALRQRRGELSAPEYQELRRLERVADADPVRLAALRTGQRKGISAAETVDLARGRKLLRRIPESAPLRLPTRLGNVLRAAERAPTDKYGLDSVACWTALWLVLPTDTQTEIAHSRAVLDNAVRVWLWGALFVVWTPWAWWALAVAFVVPAFAYYVSLLGAAQVFGDLVGAAFDLHRTALYRSLRIALPKSPIEERAVTGPLVTNALLGGISDPSMTYTPGSCGLEAD